MRGHLLMSEMVGTSGIILCGGQGTRLREVLPNLPKTLAMVDSAPLINHILDQICYTPITEVILCTGHLADQIIENIGFSYKQVKLVYSHETKPLGTGGALQNCLPYVSNEMTLVMNGDSFIDASLSDFIQFHNDAGAEVSMITKELDNPGRFGRVALDRNDCVIEFSEKKPTKREGKSQINTGVYMMKKNIIEEFRGRDKYSLEKDVFPRLIERGIQAYVTNGSFIDIGTPESYYVADKFFSDLQNR